MKTLYDSLQMNFGYTPALATDQVHSLLGSACHPLYLSVSIVLLQTEWPTSLLSFSDLK